LRLIATSLLEQIILNISYLNFYYVKNSPKAKYVLKYLINPQLRFVKLYDYIEEYSTFFPQFGKLLSLTLRSTAAGDKCLEVIGTYCKSLRYAKSIFRIIISSANNFFLFSVANLIGRWMLSIVVISQILVSVCYVSIAMALKWNIQSMKDLLVYVRPYSIC
jgi:hypothetical protein